ncbi:hypothetical protein HK102_006565, partial [Quaeritorhiza haematococci]
MAKKRTKQRTKTAASDEEENPSLYYEELERSQSALGSTHLHGAQDVILKSK